MNKILISVLAALLSTIFCLAQRSECSTYLKKHVQRIDLEAPEFQFDDAFYQHQLYFFGFVHGSQKPQLIDLKLLQHLSRHGVRYYAPEVDFSLAFFFNSYLESGDEQTLDYACHYYKYRVPQDASVQFRDKWKKLYAFNQGLPSDERIKVLGMDQHIDPELSLTHLAYIAPTQCEIAIIDSLQHFKNFQRDTLEVYSGKPAFKSGKGWDYFFSTEKSRFYHRFVKAYTRDSLIFIKAFGKEANQLRHLMSQNTNGYRDSILLTNFKKLALPLIQQGEKVYANFGYFHVQQQKINKLPPLAQLVKENTSVSCVSLLGLLSQSACMVRKIRPDGPLMIKGVRFRKAKYAGYRSLNTYDGDHLFERVNGMGILRKNSRGKDLTLFPLNGEDSPFRKTMFFADFSRGGRKWKVHKGAVTTDYFQYVFLIKNSRANIPIEEIYSR
ncbi:MAG: hypothetical protein EP338_09140 [Bacteroidetes bacterium]|nr:MAG: hypothetical protein EP338_09140 [Bacteroidota bacterium]